MKNKPAVQIDTTNTKEFSDKRIEEAMKNANIIKESILHTKELLKITPKERELAISFLDRISELELENKELKKENDNKWTQGYICAVCCMIQLYGLVQTQTREMFIAGVGKSSLKELENMGIDKNDLEILKKHWKQLIRCNKF
jgi:hypothetical protein